MEERCMRCNLLFPRTPFLRLQSTKDMHQIYHFESGCWCTKCIDIVMSGQVALLRADGYLEGEGCQSYDESGRTIRARIAKLEGAVQAAKSVLSEDGVKEFLSAYVMGVELIDRIGALGSVEKPE